MVGRQSFSDTERELLSLPAQYGGLGIPVPTENANTHYRACISVTAPLVDLICHQHYDYPTQVRQEQRQRKAAIHSNNRSETLTKANSLKSTLPTPKQRAWIRPVKRCIVLACHHFLSQVWLQPAQTGLSRCPLSEVWITTSKGLLTLPLWTSVHGEPRP